MAAIISTRILRLQAVSPRTAAVPAQSGTSISITSGTVTPTGGVANDLYYETDAKAWWANLAGIWTKVSDETAANIAASIASQGALATLDTVAAAQIATNAVETAKILANAVTQVVAAYTGAGASLTGTESDVQSITITCTGSPLIILAMGQADTSAVADGIQMYIRDGSGGTLVDWTFANGPVNATKFPVVDMFVIAAPSAASHTYVLSAKRVNGTLGANIGGRFLLALEIKR